MYTYYFPCCIGQDDFGSCQQPLSFYGSINCLHCHIKISNDDINEAAEEVFVIQLTLDYSLNPNLVNLSRNASLGIIIDDDRKLILILIEIDAIICLLHFSY